MFQALLLHERVLTQLREGVILLREEDGEILYANHTSELLLGYEPDELIGMNLGTLHAAQERSASELMAEMRAALASEGCWTGEVRQLRKDLSAVWCQVEVAAIDDGDDHTWVVTQRDITQQNKAAEETWRHANYDSLTGLPNRRLFHDRLADEVKRVPGGAALLVIGLDRFKEVNDVLGRALGDAILTQAATRIHSCVRQLDTVARLDGDEFTVLVPDATDVSHLEGLAQSVILALGQPFQVGDERVHLSASIGISACPQDTRDPSTLLRHANRAMSVAKQEGQNTVRFFTPAMQVASQRHHQLGQDLHEALARKEFSLVYQPIVNLTTGAICKAEALIRWLHPTMGMISPAEFIPIAEEVGLIGEIGEWVFRSALQAVQRWSRLAGAHFRVGVNISPSQLMNRDKLLPLLRHLRDVGASGTQVVLEITEGLLLRDCPEVEAALGGYRNAGMEIAIDDFGTGYSSLSYLAKFPLDYVKIDRAFISQLHAGSPQLALSEAIVLMGHKLGLRVIAEGIDSAEQRDLLVAAGCDLGQGYLFSKPVTAKEFEALLPCPLEPPEPPAFWTGSVGDRTLASAGVA